MMIAQLSGLTSTVSYYLASSKCRASLALYSLAAVLARALVALSLACSFMAGYGMSEQKKHSWIHVLAFAIVMTFTVYVIIDLEYPRVGFIRVSAVDQVLRDLRATMK